MDAGTKTDKAISGWAIQDEVIRLRRWGTDVVHELPWMSLETLSIGTGKGCSIQIEDRLVSRLHATLMREDGIWVIRDAGSKNGLRHDGARSDAFLLAPGIEIGIGATTLIAESECSIALWDFLSRLLGWGSDRMNTVDHALRSMRMAAAGRAALILFVDSDPVPIAAALHRHTLGADRPFIVCDPRRRDTVESVRSAKNRSTGIAALEAATGGSMCVRSNRLPTDFSAVASRLRVPNARVQLIVCSEDGDDPCAGRSVPLVIPPMKDRWKELPRIVDEYARDAADALGVLETNFTAADREWVLKYSASSLSDIEKATLRLVALRTEPNVNRAAGRLGMAAISLSRWLGRRRLPMRLPS
jgi:hypothetical protein